MGWTRVLRHQSSLFHDDRPHRNAVRLHDHGSDEYTAGQQVLVASVANCRVYHNMSLDLGGRSMRSCFKLRIALFIVAVSIPSVLATAVSAPGAVSPRSVRISVTQTGTWPPYRGLYLAVIFHENA